MARTTIKVIKDDKGYDLNFTLKDNEGVVVNLTGATLLLKVQKPGAAALKFSGSMSIVSAEAGTCKYTVLATNFDTAGDYYAEIEATYGGGSQIITFPDIVISVQSDLPK